MTGVKKNYTTMEKETLTMIHAIKKFPRYLLGNNFTLFVDHQALIYLVSKPTIFGRVTQGLLLLQKLNFKVIHKPRKVHFVPNQLSHAKNGKLIIGVED
jgi:hypothetical protein